MAVVQDASTPAGVSSNTSGTSSLTTASFTPPANSLVLVFTAGRGTTTSTTPTVTITDSSGATWTKLHGLNTKTTNGATNYCEGTAWYTYFTSSPGAITINGSWANRSGRGAWLKAYVLTGADPVPISHTNAQISSGNFPAVTTATTAVGSWMYGMAIDEVGNTFTAPYNSTQTALDYTFDGTNMSAVTVNAKTATTTPGSIQIGARTSTASGGYVAAVEVMPAKVSSVVDDFASYNSTTWAFSYGTPSVTSGQLHLNCTSSYEGIYSGVTYDLTNSSIFLQTIQVPTGGNGTRQAYMKLNVDGSNNVELFINGGVLYCRKTESGSTTTLHTVGNYNSTNHAWWKIQSDNVGGTDYVSFWTSTNGATWQQQGAATSTSFSQAALYVEVGSGYTGTETSPPDFVIDNMNVAPTTVAVSDTDYQRVESLYGFYAGSGSTGVSGIASHETLVGRSVEIASDYLPHNAWSVFNASTMRTNQLDGWRTWRDARPGSKFVYGIPLLTDSNTGDFSGVAAGTYDTYFDAAASALVAAGHSDAIIRLGWEPNNSGIGPWQATDNPSGYISAFQHVVTRFRAASGQNFKFEMSSALGFQAGHSIDAFDDYYPGSSYVDYLGMNVYDIDFNDPSSISAEARWTWIRQQVGGLDDFIAYAASKGKPIVTSEWGLYSTGDSLNGGGDNPYFIAQMIDYFNRAKPYYQCYFDWDWGGGVLSDFTDGQTAYVNYFATPGTKESTSLSITQNVSSSDSAHGTDAQSIRASLNSSQTASGSESRSISSTLNSSDSSSITESNSITASASVSSSDAASGSETWSIAVTLSGSDVGSATDSQSIQAPKSDTDAGSGNGSQSITATLSNSDALAAAESTAFVAFAFKDTTSASESATISVAVSSTDSASVAERTPVVAFNRTESASGTDSQSISASASNSDSASGTEKAPGFALSSNDTVGTSETVATSATSSSSDSVQAADINMVQDSDTEYDFSSATENFGLAVTLSDTDNSAVTESVTIAFNASDSASGVESFTVQVIALDGVSATEAEAFAMASNDSASATDNESLSASANKINVDDSLSAEAEAIAATLADLDDSSSVEESTVIAGLSGTDESSTVYTAVISVADLDGAQALDDESLAVSMSDSDESTAEEALGLALADADTSGVDEFTALATSLSDTDLSAGVDSENTDTGGSPFQLDPVASEESHSILASGAETDLSTAAETQLVHVADSDSAASTELQSLAVGLSDGDAGSSVDSTGSYDAGIANTDHGFLDDQQSTHASLVETDDVTLVDSQSVHIQGQDKDDADAAFSSESETVTVYILSSDGVTAIETDNLDATLASLDNSTLLDVWVVSHGAESSDGVTGVDSESISAYEVLGLAGIISNLHLKWAVSDASFRLEGVVNDLKVKWGVSPTIGKTMGYHDFEAKWSIINFKRSF